MRRSGIVLGIALLAVTLGVSVAAANPSITLSATRRGANGAVVALLGEYVIATGQGFPPNQPVQASLVAQNQVYPLAYQDLTTTIATPQTVPMTDASGSFQNFAFALPAPGQIVSTDGEIFVSVGSATARAPVAIDSGVATAGRGDTIAVTVGAAFLAIAIILILLLVRSLPVYPIRQTTARRVKETETETTE